MDPPLAPLIPALAGVVALAAWLYLWLAHASFWRVEREAVPPPPDAWPEVVAAIPARDEADLIGETLASLWAQDYPGGLRVALVDDQSEDGTAEAAGAAARAADRSADLTVLRGQPRPAGWAGKVWAMEQGWRHAQAAWDSAPYLLFCDADIHHGSGALRELVCRAEAGGYDLTSFMVRLPCASAAERLMVPAFVFFFRMLYPFLRVNDVRDRMAGAAGGTMLVRRSALERIGGLAAIQGDLIDDCALARAVKRGAHRIWLGLSEESRSTRGYGGLRPLVRMVARSAYTQLGHSPARLAACVAGMAAVFLAPPLLLLSGGWPAALGASAWLVMAALYLPMVRFYRLSPLWAPALPAAACVYVWATVLSAWQHSTGRGGWWKGRAGKHEAERETGRRGDGEMMG